MLDNYVTSPDLVKEVKRTEDWASLVGLMEKGTPTAQAEKIKSEALEIVEAINTLMTSANADEFQQNLVETMKELGDGLVTIIVECKLLGVDPTACLAAANEKNYARVNSGKMIGNTFVKKEDFHLYEQASS